MVTKAYYQYLPRFNGRTVCVVIITSAEDDTAYTFFYEDEPGSKVNVFYWKASPRVPQVFCDFSEAMDVHTAQAYAYLMGVAIRTAEYLQVCSPEQRDPFANHTQWQTYQPTPNVEDAFLC